MTALPRFHFASTTEGPAVVDRAQGLRARFVQVHDAQAVARMLTANPAMVDLFHWTNDQGEDQ